MKKIGCAVMTVLLMSGVVLHETLANQELTVTVTTTPKQVWRGLGYSKINNSEDNGYLDNYLSPGKFSNITAIVVDYMAPGNSTDAAADNIYGYLKAANAAGNRGWDVMTKIDCLPDYHFGLGTDAFIDWYSTIVQKVKQRGLAVDAVEWNKPNVWHWDQVDANPSLKDVQRQDADEVVYFIKEMRAALDEKGCEEIGIVGPSTMEWEPVRPIDNDTAAPTWWYQYEPDDNINFIQAIIDDEEALAAIDAFCIHNYGASTSKAVEELVAGTGKEIWMGLNAMEEGGPTEGVDIHSALLHAAQCVSDINHSVSYWVYYREDKMSRSGDGGMRQRYEMFMNLAGAFDAEAQVYGCESDQEGTPEYGSDSYADMHYNPMAEPVAVAAAMKNPDNTFSIALVNLTGIHSNAFYNPATVFTQGEADVVDVTVVLEGLVDDETEITFESRITPFDNSATGSQDGDDATMSNGAMTVSVDPRTLVTLRSTEAIPEFTSVAPHRESVTGAGGGVQSVHVSAQRIRLELSGNAPVNVSLLDCAGRNVLAREAAPGATQAIDCSTIPGGVYVLRVTGADGRTMLRKPVALF